MQLQSTVIPTNLQLHVVVLLARPRLVPELELVREPLLLRLLLPLDALEHGAVLDGAVVEARVVRVGHPAVPEVSKVPARIPAYPGVRMRSEMLGEGAVRVLLKSPR